MYHFLGAEHTVVLTLQHNVLFQNLSPVRLDSTGVLTLQHNVLFQNYRRGKLCKVRVLTLQHNVLFQNKKSILSRKNSGFDFTT